MAATNIIQQAVQPSRLPEKSVSEKETQTIESEVSERRQGAWSLVGRDSIPSNTIGKNDWHREAAPSGARVGSEGPKAAETGEELKEILARWADAGQGARDTRGLPDASATDSKSPISFADKAGDASNALERKDNDDGGIGQPRRPITHSDAA